MKKSTCRSEAPISLRAFPIGLPCSVVTMRASSSRLAFTTSEMDATSSWRRARGVARHAGNAARAAATASSSWAGEAAGTSMNGAPVDGSITGSVAADATLRPLIVRPGGRIAVGVAMVISPVAG